MTAENEAPTRLLHYGHAKPCLPAESRFFFRKIRMITSRELSVYVMNYTLCELSHFWLSHQDLFGWRVVPALGKDRSCGLIEDLVRVTL